MSSTFQKKVNQLRRKIGKETPQVWLNLKITDDIKPKLPIDETKTKWPKLSSFDPIIKFKKLTRLGEKCESIMGYRREEFYSPDFNFLTTLIAPESLDSIRERFGLHMKGEEVAPYEYTLVTRKGKKVKGLVSTKLMEFEGERAILGIVTDITDLKQMEEELRRYTEHLEELVDEKTKELKEAERMVTIGETAGMVGHDLRNPLQAIVNTVYLANMKLDALPSESAEKSEVKAYLETMERQVVYMNKIVSDLLDYTRPINPDTIETSIHQLIQGTLLSIDIPETIKISIAVPKKMKLKVDPSFMRRVFINLITNAVQAMPDGGKLTIKGSKKAGEVFISVKDTGVGIREEYLPKIFQPLFTTKSKGQGFGLPVCKRIIDAHGGDIIIESKVGKGTTVNVIIPLKTASTKAFVS